MQVNLHVDIRNTIQEARSADVPRELLEQFAARLHRLEEEREKPNGNYQPVRDLVETANHSRELFGPFAKFVVKHWDKIQMLADVPDSLF